MAGMNPGFAKYLAAKKKGKKAAPVKGKTKGKLPLWLKKKIGK